MIQSPHKNSEAPTEEGFYFGKRLMLAKNFPVITDSELSAHIEPQLGRSPAEFDRVENLLAQLIVPDKMPDLLMAATRLSEYNKNTSALLQEMATEMGLKNQLDEAAEQSQEKAEIEPLKKSFVRNYVRSTHQVSEHQTLFIDVHSSGATDNLDIIFRSGRGQVLTRIVNWQHQEGDRKLTQRLKTLPNSDTFCVFVNSNPRQTLNLEYLLHLTGRNVNFLYVQSNFRPGPEYLAEGTETLFHSFDKDSKLLLTCWKQHTVLGSHGAMRLLHNGRLAELLEQHRQMLDQEKHMLEGYPPELEGDIKFADLRYVLINLLRKNMGEGLECHTEQAVRSVIKHCLTEAQRLKIKQTENSQKETLGHYPTKLKHCKECRVCVKRYNEWLSAKKKVNRNSSLEKPKKKKSKYQCEFCSAHENKPVALCVTCFKEYHTNMDQYSEKTGRAVDMQSEPFAHPAPREMMDRQRQRAPRQEMMYSADSTMATIKMEQNMVPPEADRMKNEYEYLREYVQRYGVSYCLLSIAGMVSEVNPNRQGQYDQQKLRQSASKPFC